MDIREYDKKLDEETVMRLIEAEGEEWACYSSSDASDQYKSALDKSITYVAYEGEDLCGFSRSVEDNDFYMYVCDLLVAPTYRGKNIGRELMECLHRDYPDQVSYVMSDVDGYYTKLGYRREGSIFEVRKR